MPVSKTAGKVARWAGRQIWKAITTQASPIEIGIPGLRQREINSSRVIYDDYIRSAKWRKRAQVAKVAAGHRCQICYTPESEAVLHTHHRTYRNLGNEKPEDLIVLCEDCHFLFHRHRRLWHP